MNYRARGDSTELPLAQLTLELWGFCVPAGRIWLCAKPYPTGFQCKIVEIDRKHEAALAQIAKDFSISEATSGSMRRDFWKP